MGAPSPLGGRAKRTPTWSNANTSVVPADASRALPYHAPSLGTQASSRRTLPVPMQPDQERYRTTTSSPLVVGPICKAYPDRPPPSPPQDDITPCPHTTASRTASLRTPAGILAPCRACHPGVRERHTPLQWAGGTMSWRRDGREDRFVW